MVEAIPSTEHSKVVQALVANFKVAIDHYELDRDSFIEGLSFVSSPQQKVSLEAELIPDAFAACRVAET
jgi:hypothetical protein